MEIIFSEDCLDYSYFGHIETSERVKIASEILEKTGYSFVEPEPISEEDLLRVHSTNWVERVKRGGFFDEDTPGSKNIYKYANLSAGGALLAANVKGFSLLRPPGHHAGKNGRALGASTLGFCYFNNMAIAVKHLNQRTLILDIDGHHGNGTQEIFTGHPKVTYISLHLVPEFPGTGLNSEINCYNFPLPPGTGDKLYLKTLDKALDHVDMKKIDIIGISAGFDAHQGDLASLDLTSNCFREIGKRVRDLGIEVFGVLEGGYLGGNIASDLHHLIQGLEKG